MTSRVRGQSRSWGSCPSPGQLPTLTSGLAWHRVEARAAGTVGSFLGAHTTGFVTAEAGVGGAAGQLGVCGRQTVDFLPRAPPRGTQPSVLTRWGGGGLPMLQSSSSEPSPQSSNMLQRSEDDRQRWFRQRNSFLSLQWGFCVVGGSGEGGGFRLWGLTALPCLPQRPG